MRVSYFTERFNSEIFYINASSILMLFYYLTPLKNDSILMSRCMQFTLGDEREVYLLDESALPVPKKKVCKRGKEALAIGRNMDTQTNFPSRILSFSVTLIQQVNLSLVPKSELHAS